MEEIFLHQGRIQRRDSMISALGWKYNHLRTFRKDVNPSLCFPTLSAPWLIGRPACLRPQELSWSWQGSCNPDTQGVILYKDHTKRKFNYKYIYVGEIIIPQSPSKSMTKLAGPINLTDPKRPGRSWGIEYSLKNLMNILGHQNRG
jgi:hypothetical protein